MSDEPSRPRYGAVLEEPCYRTGWTITRTFHLLIGVTENNTSSYTYHAVLYITESFAGQSQVTNNYM